MRDLRTLVHRNTEQAYWEYVEGIGVLKRHIDPEDREAHSAEISRPGRTDEQ